MSRRACLLLLPVVLWGCANNGPTGTGTGGSSAIGGTTGSGGAQASGGNTGSGGVLGTGGDSSSGGAPGTGGSAATGGGTGIGGASGTAGGAGGAKGGSTGTGDASGTGGAKGGSTGTGGASGGTTGTGGTGGATSCPGASADPASPPATLTLSGNLGAHDPAAYVDGSTIYLAATGLIAKTSPNLTTWNAGPNPLPLPSWAASMTGATNLWAPDISYFGGLYHLYYAASTFGKNKSCIGQATRAALDSGSWTDQGMVICSNVGTSDDWNAIDPNVVIDDAGTPWLVLGSFWSGIKAVKLDTAGKRADTMVYAIANHANGGIEGAWVFKRCGYYYLFVSWGACCSGAYDYNIRVGRSTSVTGPYVDKAGIQMMSGGGTLLVQGNASWVAPGHNAVIAYNGKTYNLYHALKGSSSGPATLRVSELVWDADGWPISGGP